MLELGCGPARDSAFFARLGHTVVATDFSLVILAPARSIFAAKSGLHFCLLDTSAPLPFRDDTFNAAYARLSLHYFPDQVTRRVFRELHRVLRPDGLLCFMCKSTGDPLHGQGRQIEPDMFERDGHLRHFFSPAYARACLDPDFTLIQLDDRRGPLSGQPSAFIEVIAQAR
ncbi:MAG: class I SAM-dependent methyltransferase [Chloroflexota bacterium]|nr:class I SAM-dependent methyltransferase [Chloroflexota bacterium]